jgi:hypothetical protein
MTPANAPCVPGKGTPRHEKAPGHHPVALTEKDVYEACVSLLEQTGSAVYRLSQARASRQTPGLPDLIAFTPRPRKMLCIEVKKPGGRVRLAQLHFALYVATTTEPPYHLFVDDPQKLVPLIGARR